MRKVQGKVEIIEKLNSKEVIDFINKYNITTILIFGSIINDEFNDESDVDLALLAKELKVDKQSYDNGNNLMKNKKYNESINTFKTVSKKSKKLYSMA
ncbi:nucleotidyltransferase domain-containing protein [Clostridium sporogenes]|uniref:nucleotidyltransferase domain-containing protein n=1 Tax=unclassified Clostridium TaxID=2614128 RepID=UPI0013D768FD|nr:nucleotidyltransferase domain-containing protein [Clostridium sporogenes]NFS25569.1 nucleotidyltransferase domain-containing protein [Clostridium sporogenes]